MRKIFIPILFLFYSTVYSQDNRGYIVGINDPAPHFKITNKDDTFSLKDHLGKIIISRDSQTRTSPPLRK